MWTKERVYRLCMMRDVDQLIQWRMTGGTCMNGFEYALFHDMASVVKPVMLYAGKTYSDVISPHIQVSCPPESLHQLKRFAWTPQLVHTFSYTKNIQALLDQTPNAFAYSLINCERLSRIVGDVVRHHELLLCHVLPHHHLKDVPPQHLRAFYACQRATARKTGRSAAAARASRAGTPTR